MILKYYNGKFYRLKHVFLSKHIVGRCYKCALYEHCDKGMPKLCGDMKDTAYFVQVPRSSNKEIENINDFDFSKPKARYRGEVLDKCSMSHWIHVTDFMLGNDDWPTYYDIYWDSAKYDEMKNELKDNVELLRRISA